MTQDPVNHPKHYTWLRDVAGVEAIDICQCFNFTLGNALKYLLRAGRKDPAKTLEDLKKARWYIDHEIERMEASEPQTYERPEELTSTT